MITKNIKKGGEGGNKAKILQRKKVNVGGGGGNKN